MRTCRNPGCTNTVARRGNQCRPCSVQAIHARPCRYGHGPRAPYGKEWRCPVCVRAHMLRMHARRKAEQAKPMAGTTGIYWRDLEPAA